MWKLAIQNPGFLISWRSSGPYPSLISITSDLIAGKRGGSDLEEWAKTKIWSAAYNYDDAVFFMDACRSNIVALQTFVDQRSLNASPWSGRAIPNRYLVSCGLLIDLGNFFKILARSETLNSLCVTAIAIKRFELKHGRVPSTVEELKGDFVLEIPTDWYDGKPIRYEQETKSTYRLWSVGKDGIDGGGFSVSTNANPLWDQDMIWPKPATPEDVARMRAELETKMTAAPKP